ncbi:14461_t:CDS:1 [Funneliformis geosporum]|uniref:3740_t:CDS:1 n=1 Tax=Funneliformis geosporum TaxID=1117311 RepID=A0A9W4SDL9_9GLOM|nr:3740_t:CDS:1 [Funneliformis geosporum]CAI2171654.1 14461_t:CDS:1 [Funneliformis geosporum]
METHHNNYFTLQKKGEEIENFSDIEHQHEEMVKEISERFNNNLENLHIESMVQDIYLKQQNEYFDRIKQLFETYIKAEEKMTRLRIENTNLKVKLDDYPKFQDNYLKLHDENNVLKGNLTEISKKYKKSEENVENLNLFVFILLLGFFFLVIFEYESDLSYIDMMM